MKFRTFALFLPLIFGLGLAPQVAPAANTVSGIDMQIGDQLYVTCPGALTYADGILSCVEGQPLPTLTPTSAPTATSSPTSAPTPTTAPTSTPNGTIPPATSTPGEIAPYAGAPKCADHDTSVWHSLWNSVLGCHYDHEHGVDPNAMASYAISGTNITYGPIENYTGPQLGYVWQTTGENVLKHTGYHVQSALDLPCEQQNYLYMPESQRKCIRSFRIVAHVDHAVREGVGRFHSFSAEVEGCSRDGSVCGIIRTGGLNDTGDAQAPYKVNCIEPAGSNRPPCPDAAIWDYQKHSPPYWAFTLLSDAQHNLAVGNLCRDASCQNQASPQMVWENLSGDRTPSIGNREGVANLLLHMNLRTYNAAAAYDPSDQTFKFVCPDGSCMATGDAVYVYAVAFEVPTWAADSSGIVNYTGYTDRAGNIDRDGRCFQVDVECVPLVIEHLQPGLYVYDMTAPFLPGLRTWGDGVVTDGVRYFDTTPAGEPVSWIELR